MIIISILMNTIQICLFLIILYQLTVGLFGFRRFPVPLPAPPCKRFAIVIPAHNEERVIGQLIHNLQKVSYPKELYDIFVICDNCTDQTARQAKKAGARIAIRRDPYKKGKGYALSWMFQRLLSTYPERWDAFIILDADNLVSSNLLQVMNTYLQNGHRLLQACLDVKNPDDSWISRCYALSYWATNRIFQLARYNLGWSCVLGGTGICVESGLLKEIGWQATSLTEDLEFTLQSLIHKNVRAIWLHHAKIYDEKPTTLAQSVRQRIRWMQGHADCLFRYLIPLCKQGIKSRNLSMIDICFYLLQPFVIVATGVILVCALLQGYHPFYWSVLGEVPWMVREMAVVAELCIPLMGLLYERVSLTRLFGSFYLPFFSITWIPLALIGILRHKTKNWSHTEHTRVVSDEELLQLTGLALSDDYQTQ